MISLGSPGREALHFMLNNKLECGDLALQSAQSYEPNAGDRTNNGSSLFDPGYSSGEATVTAETSLKRSRSRSGPASKSSNLRRRVGVPADHKGLNREEGVIRRSSSSAGLRNFGNAGDQRNGSHTPKPDIPAVRNESLAKGLQARHLLRALGRPREESLAHKPSRRWDQSMSPDWTRPTDSQPAGNYGLIRSHSFESSVGDLYVAASQHETTGAFLSMESSPFPYVTPSIHGEGATSEQPFRSTSAEDTSRKAGKTPPPPRMPARRLSEGSSCGSRDALRPGLHRNFSSTNSVTSYWSRLSANDTDGASSNAENEILDKHLLARLKPRGKAMYAATGPTSPLSDDGSRLSDANAELARAVKRGGAKPRSIMLSTLLFGLRLLAVVPATLGSLALIWPIVQGEIREPSAIANSLMTLPWTIVTGVFCFELTSGLSQRWLLHYALAPTLLRLVSLQSLCWPCTFLTLRYIGSIDILLGWIVVATTTACSRSVQIWVTSNVPDQLQPRAVEAQPTSVEATVDVGDEKKPAIDTTRGDGVRVWDWQEIGQAVWIRVALLYGVTTWFLLGARLYY